ncbi:MAG: hypothetical protein D6702_00500 [Planctomycetota bacterium]|nr:MAG: hypothetical protein D6702_00500 [Planctomycetota bacterium]
MRSFLLVAGLLLPPFLAVPACQAGSGVWAATDTPHDYRLSFRSGSHLEGAVGFHAVLTLEDGQEVWLNLEAHNGELAAYAAERWASALNARRAGLARASSNTLVLHRILAIELRGPLRGLKLKDLGESL